ncbi:MAG: flagellar motor protein MotB [Pseudomonadota bacterium]
MAVPSNGPVIVKRKKVIKRGEHHGGAWKVAYADFVTAMMAFFMLMWLLGATNENQRKGIADFFNPTVPVNKVSGGGDGAFGGDSVFTERTLARNGTGAAAQKPTAQNAARGALGPGEAGEQDQDTADATGEDAVLAEVERELSGIGGESLVTELLQRHITSRLTDEGLIVELFDQEAAPLFKEDGTPTDTMRALLQAVAEVFARAENELAIQGHTAALPIVKRDNPVWEVSTARARMVQTELEAAGLPASRFQRVTGFADRRPVSSNPLSGRNNRVELILLRSKI